MQTDYSTSVEHFLKIVQSAQNKSDFLSKAKQFDQKFVDAYPTPNYVTNNSNYQRQSTSHDMPTPPQPIKNPFISGQFKATPRTNNFMNTPQNVNHTMYQNIGKPPQMPQTRSQQNFYKPPSAQNREPNFMKNQMNMEKQYTQLQDPFSKHYTSDRQMIQLQDQFAKHYVAQSSGPYVPNYPDPYQKMSFGASSSGFSENMGGNQFLTGLNQEPEYVKYYKKTNHQQQRQQNQQLIQDQRFNPFAKS